MSSRFPCSRWKGLLCPLCTAFCWVALCSWLHSSGKLERSPKQVSVPAVTRPSHVAGSSKLFRLKNTLNIRAQCRKGHFFNVYKISFPGFKAHASDNLIWETGTKLYIPQPIPSHSELHSTKADATLCHITLPKLLSPNIGYSCEVHHRVLSLQLSEPQSFMPQWLHLENVLLISADDIVYDFLPSFRVRNPKSDNFIEN